jgi:adenylate cyclase
VVASEAAVLAAAADEQAHWVRDAELELRGRGELTTTWVARR